MIVIEKEGLFKEALSDGVNIFAGSGFSLLPDENNKKLKNVKELSKTICEVFLPNNKYIDELDKLSELAVNSVGKKEFKDFLIKEYTVSSYNKLYDELNKININSFITTNIDNIVHCVIDNSNRYYLFDKTLGAVKRNGIALEYIPLHGCVNNIEGELLFTKTQIASASSLQSSLFEAMRVRLSEKPTLFIGYGFGDSSTDYSLSQLFTNRKYPYWILCLPNNKDVDYYKEMGAHIITGTTEDFFMWVKDNIKGINHDKEEVKLTDGILKNYMMPTRNSLKYTRKKKDYYLKGETDWYNILYDHPYKTKEVDNIKDIYLKNKNVLVVGFPFSGKTTILMQLMLTISGNKFYFEKLEQELANLVINNLSNEKATILVDNCTDDIYGYIKLASRENIRIIGFTDNISFESSKFILDNKIQYYKYEIEDISYDEAQRIYNHIPNNIKASKFSYKAEEEEKFSMFEMMGKNVKNVISRDRVKSILDKIKEKIKYGIDIIGLTCYLSKFHSALSMDIMFSYFDNIKSDNKYKILNDIINKVKDFLAEETGSSLDLEKLDQDYYTLRSHIFMEHTHNVLVENFSTIYSQIIKKLITKVKPIYIINYKAFSRKAYDSQFFYDLFGKDGMSIYKVIYDNDQRNYYTLQQMALYMGTIKKFREAHEYIDRAKEMSPNNYSIKNSRAIILFEANKHVDDKNRDKGIKNLIEAMRILDNCHKNDERKVYHSQKYAEFAIYLNNKFKIKDYLKQSLEWLKEIELKIGASKRTKSLIRELEKTIC